MTIYILMQSHRGGHELLGAYKDKNRAHQVCDWLNNLHPDYWGYFVEEKRLRSK